MRVVLYGLLLSMLSVIIACKAGPTKELASRPAAGTSATTQPVKSVAKIVAFGDSLTAGYGLSPEDSYPALLQKKLAADGFDYEVVNAGINGDTSAGGVRRI